jgi:polyisoprenoid-binding protein YceI
MASSTNIGEGPVASYVLDPARSRFQVRAVATGLLSAFGHNPTIAIRNFTGEAWYRPQALEQSSVRVEIDAASLAVAGDVNDKDRQEMERAMREEVLETERYSLILFESYAIQAGRIAEGMYRMKITGKLTLHGVTRDLEFPSTLTAGDDNLRANGEFSIRQTDYRIKLVSVAGGTLQLKDELKFTFDVVAQRNRAATVRERS